MATLALAAVGNAIAPGIGQFIGAAVGSYIDQVFLFPAPDTKGPRLDSLQLSSASEGTPMYFCLGQECRVAGEYIFASDLDERAISQGKGGPSNTSYTYSCDTAIAFCEGPINRIVKLWANGKVIYDDDPDITVVSNQLTVTKITVKRYYGNYESNYVDYILMDITSPINGPDLTQFKTGVDIQISGWSTSGNNGTFRVDGTYKNELTGDTILRIKNNTSVTNDAGGETVTLFQDLPKFDTEDFEAITFYTGTSTQIANSLIESHLGTGNVPGYRNVAYCVIERFELKDYGNILPQVQALIEESSGVRTLADGLLKICARSKLSTSIFDTSEVIGNIRGYSIRGPQPIDQQLAPLLVANDILTQEDNGIIRFFNRANADSVALNSEELVAHQAGEDPPRPIETSTARGQRLPKLVVVNYADPLMDYLKGSQSDVRNQSVSDYTITMDLENLVLTAIEAKTIARRVLWTAVANAKRHKLQVGPSRVDILENDIVTVTLNGINYRVLLNQVDQGQNGICLLEGGNEAASTLSFDNLTADDPVDPNGDIHTPPEMFGEILDIAPLRDEELTLPGYYYAACASTFEVAFDGAGLFVSEDGGANYTNVLTISSESVIGYCTNALGNASYGYTDNKNTLTVELFHGTLESNSRLSVLAGLNWALVGKEIIAFESAVLTASRTYQLSVLYRGLRSTDDQMAGHISGEVFVLLDSNSILFRTIPANRINSTQSFKIVSNGQLLGSVTAVSYAVKGNNLKPFPPCNIQATRDGSNNVTLTWIRRTRAPVRLLGGGGIPLAEESERYEVELLNVAESAVLTTISVSGAATTTITDATITGLGLVSGAAIHVRIYQKSAVVGRGKGRLAVV